MRCWYTRWQMSNALDRGELAARTIRGHAARCASCRAFGDRLAALDAQLSREVHTAAVPVVPIGRGRRARARWLVAGPLVAGAAVIAVVVVSNRQDRPIAGPAPAAQLQAAETLVRMRGLAEGVSRVLAKSPLETELDDLIRDGRRGLDEVLATGGLRQP